MGELSLVLGGATVGAPPSFRSEHVLMARVAAGDVAAVGELYDRVHARVRAFARRLVGDVASAEDLVHEVFVALPRAARGFRGDSSVESFVCGVAVNHAKHHLRAAARRRAAHDRWGALPRADDPPADHELRRRELATALTRALDQLPLEQRVAFVLCEVEELSHAEAAAIAAAPEATLRTRLFHAKKKLRALLEAERTP